MKRRISIYLMSAVAMFAAVGCTVEDIVKINEADVIVPVLHNPGLPEVITITPSNQSDEIEFTWDAAHIGFGAQLNYTVEVSLSPDKSVRTYELTGGVASTTSSVKYEDLNYSLIYSLGVKPAESAEVYFYVSAAVGTKKYFSEPLAAKVVPTDAPKQFPHIYFIGSYCDWNHNQAQMMYDYSENGLEYQGLIDFGEEFMTTTFQGFKLTPEGNWNAEWAEPEAWESDYEDRLESGELSRDPEEVEFATSGGNCLRYSFSHRFYHFTMSTETNLFTMQAAFDNAVLHFDDMDLPLSFHGAKHSQKFYTDVVVKTGSKFSVSIDDNASTVFGADESNTPGLLVINEEEVVAAEVPVEPGNYRLYINMNDWGAVTYEFNSDKFDTEEGSGAVAETYEGWGICGYMNKWKGDVPMEYDGECWWVAKDVYLEYDYDFIFRKDGASAVVFQGGGFKIGEATMQKRDGSHIVITKSGYYDIYLNPTNGCAWFLNPGGVPTSGTSPLRPDGCSDWAICGTMNQWGGPEGAEGTMPDIWMKTTSFPEGEEVIQAYVAENVALEAGDMFKFRYLYRWDLDERGSDAMVSPGYWYRVQKNSGNITVETAGNYDIYLSAKTDRCWMIEAGGDPSEAEELIVDYADWSVSGSFNNWGQRQMIEKDGYYVAKGISMNVGDAFKFRKGEWEDDRSVAKAIAPDTYNKLQPKGAGDTVVGEAGTYDIYLATDLSKMYFMKAGTDISEAKDGSDVDPFKVPWSIVGSFTNEWSTDIVMEEEGDYYVAKGVEIPASSEFKFRKNRGWGEVRTYNGEVSADGEYDVVNNSDGAANIKVPVGGTYDIYLSKSLDKFWLMSQGKVPGQN